MRHFLGKGLFVVLFLGFSCLSYAQQDARNEDHEKLRALKIRAADAFNKRDAQAIASCFTKEFAVTTIDQTTLTSAAEIEQHFKKVFNSPGSFVTDMKVDPDPEILTRFIDADNGYCYGKNHETYTMKGGRVVPMESRWTASVHKENGEWKITTIHAGINFLNNPVLARTKARAKAMAVGGFAGGVVLTLLCGGIYFRRRSAKN
jgi:uncharacterized protein (TIGR02246 family)